MTTRTIKILCIAMILVCTSVSVIAKPKRSSQQPNIIFFIADDMYPEMFNCLPEGKGKNLTPALDRLASEGTILMGQHVVSPVCTPSRFNCLTGRYASRATNKEFTDFTRKNAGQTVIQWNSFMKAGDPTVASLLQKGGYVTGFVGKNHVVDVPNLHRFPDYYADARDPKIVAKLQDNKKRIATAIQKSGFDYAASIYHNNPNWIGLRDLAVQNLDWIAKGGLDFIDENHEKPFFLYFATTVPHGPSGDDRSWNADPRVTADGILDEPLRVLPHRDTIIPRLKKAGKPLGHQKNVLWLDDSLNALIKRLEKYNILDNTIIFFFNDHGQNAKGTVYQGGVYNPSIVWQQGGFDCGTKTDALVSNVDFAPTILELAGLPIPPKHFDGRSFKAVLDGKKTETPEALYFELGYARGIRKGNFKYIAVRYPAYAQDYTLAERQKILKEYNDERKSMGMEIVNEDPSKPFSHLCMVPGGGHAEFRSTGKYNGYYDPDQLYDLSKDPGEQNNLAQNPEYKEKLAEMKQILQQYLDDLPGEFAL